jgi:hypothetical protein
MLNSQPHQTEAGENEESAAQMTERTHLEDGDGNLIEELNLHLNC